MSRDALNAEIDLVQILQQLRLFKAALKILLSKERYDCMKQDTLKITFYDSSDQ